MMTYIQSECYTPVSASNELLSPPPPPGRKLTAHANTANLVPLFFPASYSLIDSSCVGLLDCFALLTVDSTTSSLIANSSASHSILKARPMFGPNNNHPTQEKREHALLNQIPPLPFSSPENNTTNHETKATQDDILCKTFEALVSASAIQESSDRNLPLGFKFDSSVKVVGKVDHNKGKTKKLMTFQQSTMRPSGLKKKRSGFVARCA